MYLVSFEVMGILLAVTLMATYLILFERNGKMHAVFFQYVLFVILECGLNVITAKGIDGYFHFSDRLSLFLNSIYFITALFCACLGFVLVGAKIGYVSNVTKLLAYLFLFIGVALFVVNMFTGVAFSFEDGKYIKHMWVFIVFYILSFAYAIMIIITLIVHRNDITKENKIPPYFLILILFVTFVIQTLIPAILLTGFGKALAAMVFCVSMDVPEHVSVKVAVQKLKRSQVDALCALAEVEQANEQKTDFLIQASHELRTPINTILGFDEILLRESDEPFVREKAQNLYSLGESLLELVNYLVDFSQLETSQIELNLNEYNIVGAYSVIYSRLHRILDGTIVSIDNSISEEMPKRLYGDEIRICQVLEEITKFILKQNIPGKMKLEVKNKDMVDNHVFIEFKVCFMGNGVNIIPKVKLSDIDYLYIERILEAMNTKLETEYTADGENIFRMYFEQEIVDMKSVGNVKSKIAELIGKEEQQEIEQKFVMPDARILIVDDTPVNLKVFEGLIAPYRTQLTRASSGKEALDIMKKQHFDLVFLDILMPEMDGVETLEHIRNDEGIISKDVNVVALTANVFIGARKQYLSYGFSDYISKPVNTKKIYDTLMTFLYDFIETDWAKLEVTNDESTESVMEMEKDLEERYTGFLGGLGSDVHEEPVKFIDMNYGENLETTPVMNDANPYSGVPGLDFQTGLELCMGDIDLYKEVVQEYCTNDSLDKLSGFYENKDWENYRIFIHGLKSSSKTIGLNVLSEGARKLEDAAKILNTDYIKENHDTWVAEYIEVTGIMSQLF